MKGSCADRSARVGFTLVEVLVALGLAAVLLAGVQSLIVHAFRVEATLEAQQNDADRRALPVQLFSQDLTQLASANGVELRNNALQLSTLNALQSDRIATRHAVTVSYRTVSLADGTLQLL